jgi:hypothetical protein
VKIKDAWFLARMLYQSQKMMDPEAYLAEHRLVAPGTWRARSEPQRRERQPA